ncbi:MAG: alanine/glycine:cation symporter family protein [Anaeroplasmataceae bacterium]
MFLSILSKISDFIDKINGNILSPIMMILILGTGILLTVRLKCLQVTYFPHSISETIVPSVKSIFVKNEKEKKKGAVSQFQAFSAAIAGTVGTGNIVGVSTALCLGGPGAIFWMWFSAFFGMLTNFSENVLGIYYRQKNEKGEYRGGAMYYITHGLGWKWLAIMFSAFCVLASIGYNMAQVNSISSTLKSSINVPLLVTGIIVAVIVFLVIVGGIERIGKIASYIVPIMALIFIFLAIIIIFMNVTAIPNAFKRIFSEAFSFKSFGSGIMGYGILRGMRYGVARGVFSNEAGLGSSVMAHCASDVKEPVKQGLWGIFEVFLDTFIICTLMALVFLTSGAYDLYLSGLIEKGAPMALWAFENNLGLFGKIIFTIILPLFAFTTVLSWEYYGECGASYLFGDKAILPFKIIYVLLVVAGATLKIDIVWNLSDSFNVLMAVPNLIAVILLSGVLKRVVLNYKQRRKDKSIKPMLSVYEKHNEELIKELYTELEIEVK